MPIKQYKLYADEQGNKIFPVHPEQTGYLINEENAVAKTGQQIGYKTVGVLIQMPI